MRCLVSLAPSALLWQGSSPAKTNKATTQLTFAERIAEDTWLRLKRSRKYRVRLGEETLTDIVVLDLAGWANGGRLQLYQPTKAEESVRGTDLEMFVRTGSTSAVHLAIQAKKLGRSRRYDHLGARVGQTGILQIDRLEAHARLRNAIPLYLLYNDVDVSQTKDCWHCCQQQCGERQFGCTLVPSWIVRHAIGSYGCRTFYHVHGPRYKKCKNRLRESALPWRCYFHCPVGMSALLEQLQSSYNSSRENLLNEEDDELYGWLQFRPKTDAWPEWLWSRDDSGLLSRDDLEKLYIPTSGEGMLVSTARQTKDQCDAVPESLPKRILLVDPGDFRSGVSSALDSGH